MNQRTLTDFEKYTKVTRRAQFLSDMQTVVPWEKLIGLVRPLYPRLGEQGGRPPIPLERMLRVYCLQPWVARGNDVQEGRPQMRRGSLVARFVVIGAGVGAAIGAATGRMAQPFALGVALGAALGYHLSKRAARKGSVGKDT